MTAQHSIEEFAENLRQDVLAQAESVEQDMMLSDLFTQTVFDLLSEAGEFEDPLVCYHRVRGMEVSGYSVDEDEARVDLFLSIHTNSTPPETVTRQRVEVAFRRLHSFLEWCLDGRYVELEESSPVFDMAAHIHGSKDKSGQGKAVCDHRWQDHCGEGARRFLPRGHCGHLLPVGCRQASSREHLRPSARCHFD